MVLSFPAPRQEKKHAIAESNPRRTASPIGDGMQEPGFTGALAASSAPPGESTTTALDLRLASPPDTTLPSKDFLKHTTVLDYHATRYERAWISEGNLTHVVARRSMIAGALLGALGALREPCTDADRRNYKAGCVPDQYEYKPEELDD